MKKPENINVKDVEKAVGEPAKKWVSRCHEIACCVVDEGLVKGRAVYGLYLGPVDPNSYFNSRRPGHRHGWVKLKGGRVLDPTRWIFEDVPPYIYCGPASREYDEGMQGLRAALRRPCPEPGEPGFETGQPDQMLYVSNACAAQLKALANNQGERDHLSILLPFSVMHWLCNSPTDLLHPFAREFFVAVANKGNKAMIPIDNWLLVMEEFDDEA